MFSPMDETPLLRVGDALGRFEITGVVAGGGMGEVYRARDTQLQRDVAIKLLRRSDPHDLDRFRREAATGASFSHPHIVSVFDVGTHQHGDRTFPYLVMQFIEGQSLRKRIGGASREQLVRWLSEVADGLDALHRRGVVHRDIKPENIMIGTDHRARIVDFGLAKTDGTTVTTEGTVVGTMDYLSPEQAAGHRLNYRSDIFSFGIVLCEALTGQHPFRAATVPETVRRIYHEPPLRVPDGELGVIAARCLKKEPKERYDDAADLARDLREQVAATSGAVTPPSELAPAADATTERMAPLQASTASKPFFPRAWWIFVLAAVLVVGTIAQYKRNSPPKEESPPQAAPMVAAVQQQGTLLPSCGLTASPGTINFGQTAELRWSSTNVADVVISPGVGIVGLNGSRDVSPRVTTTYEVVATNADGVVARASAMVNVVNVPANFKHVPVAGSILVGPDRIRPGEETLLKWNSFGATRVVITPSIGIVPLRGSIRVAPRTTTTYRLSLANDSDGFGSGSATVTVDPNATPQPAANVRVGTTCVVETQAGIGSSDSGSTSCSAPPDRRVRQATLEYTLDDAGEIEIDGRNVFTKRAGEGNRQGTITLPVDLFVPGRSFLVRVAARNLRSTGGAPSGMVFGKAVVHVVTTPPGATASITVSPGMISKGGTAQLRWASTDATGVAINPVGIVAPEGSMTVAPKETTIYTITVISANGDQGRAHATVTVQ